MLLLLFVCLVSTISTSTLEQSEGTTVMEPGTLSTILSSASESTQTGNESTKKKSTSRERSGMTIHDEIVWRFHCHLTVNKSYPFYIT